MCRKLPGFNRQFLVSDQNSLRFISRLNRYQNRNVTELAFCSLEYFLFEWFSRSRDQEMAEENKLKYAAYSVTQSSDLSTEEIPREPGSRGRSSTNTAQSRRTRHTMSFPCHFPTRLVGLRRRGMLRRLLLSPGALEGVMKLRRGRVLWAVHPTPQSQRGFWEKNVLSRWRRTAQELYQKSGSITRAKQYVEKKYLEEFRVGTATFRWILRLCEADMTFQSTNMRKPVGAAKRLAVLLSWLAHGHSESHLANSFHLGQSTVNGILRHGVTTLRRVLVPLAIRFPQGEALRRDMAEFEQVAGLPLCCGSMDGTFMKIRKPVVWGDAYWCYKSFPAIIVLATVNADGLYTYIDAGRAGSLGDAFTFNQSQLQRNLENGTWLGEDTRVEGGHRIRQYLVADSAFALSPYLMKGYPHPPQPGIQQNLNRAVCRARKISEQAFGSTKERFKILVKGSVRDPQFAASVAMVCCALNNVCARAADMTKTTFVPDPRNYAPVLGAHQGPISAAIPIRNALANYV